MEIENKASILSNDSGNVCRVCLATNQNNQCIFNAKQSNSIDEDTIDLSEKLRLCSGIEVSLISILSFFLSIFHYIFQYVFLLTDIRK